MAFAKKGSTLLHASTSNGGIRAQSRCGKLASHIPSLLRQGLHAPAVAVRLVAQTYRAPHKRTAPGLLK